MKVGNTSQTLITVPDMFYTRDLNEILAFKKNVTINSKHFTERNLFKKEVVNLSNNNRYNNKKHEEYNKKKYQPLYKLPLLQTELDKNTPSIIDNFTHKNKETSLTKKNTEFNKNEPSLYSNEDKKRNFMEKVITLLTDINNGDPNFDIVNPLTDSQDKSFEVKKKIHGTNFTERSSLLELDLVKSKFNLVFGQNKGSYSKDFINSVERKSKEILESKKVPTLKKTVKKEKISETLREDTQRSIKEIKEKLEEKAENDIRFKCIRKNKYAKEKEEMERVAIELGKTCESEQAPSVLVTEENTRTNRNLKLPVIELKEDKYNSVKSFDSFSALNYKIYFK
jgi:hypothetical protein